MENQSKEFDSSNQTSGDEETGSSAAPSLRFILAVAELLQTEPDPIRRDATAATADNLPYSPSTREYDIHPCIDPETTRLQFR